MALLGALCRPAISRTEEGPAKTMASMGIRSTPKPRERGIVLEQLRILVCIGRGIPPPGVCGRGPLLKSTHREQQVLLVQISQQVREQR